MVGVSRRSRKSNTKITPQPPKVAAAAMKTFFRHNLTKKTMATVLVLCALVTSLLLPQYQYQQSSANLSSTMDNNDTVAAKKQVVGSKGEEEVALVQTLIQASDNSTVQFCGCNKWLGSNIECEKRAQFLVSRYHSSEQNAKSSLLKSGCQCNGTSQQESRPSHNYSQTTAGTIRSATTKCPLRDLSEFSTQTIGKKFVDAVPEMLECSNCLFFDCNKDINECDNGEPTNYDGPTPPCCTHVLRDMSRIFDEEMCSLGLDYVAGFGALLGLHRSDRFIPWLIDHDILITSPEAMNALVMLWDSKKTGLSHHRDWINRMCVTPDFAGGALMKWARPECSEQGHFFFKGGCFEWDRSWDGGFPYIDLYVGQPKDDYKMFSVGTSCLHLYRDVFPTYRKPVYNGQFTINFPPNPDQLLRTYYGKGWMFPPSDEEKKEHGAPGQVCPYGPTIN